jgi:hypothetical protein
MVAESLVPRRTARERSAYAAEAPVGGQGD